MRMFPMVTVPMMMLAWISAGTGEIAFGQTDEKSGTVVAPADAPANGAASGPVNGPVNGPENIQPPIKIKVIEKGTGVVIKRAEVKVGDQKVFTGPDGTADISPLAEGQVLVVSRFGFTAVELTAKEISGKTTLDIYLPPALGGDDVVIISGRKKPGVSKKTISIEEAVKVAPRGDPGQITKVMPGVQTQGFRSEVSIRGSEPRDSKYYIDDLEVPFLYHTIGQFTVLPASLISDVEFSSGGFGAEYGDASGGVVVIRTKDEIPDRPLTRFNINLPIYSGVSHERPLSETSSINVSYRRSYLDLILPKVLPKDSGLTIIPYFKDSHIVYLKKYEDGHDKVTIMSADDGLKATTQGISNSEDGRGTFDVYTYYGIFGVEHLRRLNADWTYTTTPQLMYTNNRISIVSNKFQLQVWRLRAPTEFTLRLNRDDRIYFGFEPVVTQAKVYFLLPRFNPDDPFFDFEEAPKEEGSDKVLYQQVSTWLAADKRLGSFILTPGVRAFYSPEIKKVGADPRLSMRYEVDTSHTLKGAVGQYSKTPENGEASKDYGNPNLRFERTNHYILGIESQWTDRWVTDFQVFYKRGYWLVKNDTEDRYSNTGRLESRGFEAFIRRNLTARLFGWFTYTYSITRERNDDNEDWYRGTYDQTHVANLVTSYKLTSLWELGGRLKMNSGDTYTPKGNAVYNANLDKYQPRDNGEGVNSGRLPTYRELSLFASREFLANTWKSMLRFGLEYLWLKPQVYGVQYNYDYSKEEYFTGIPVIPYIEYKGEF